MDIAKRLEKRLLPEAIEHDELLHNAEELLHQVTEMEKNLENTRLQLTNLIERLKFDDARYDLYSNQYIPLSKQVPMYDRIVAQGKLDGSVQGGSILHLNIDEQITEEQVKKLILLSASKGVIYFALNMSISKCRSCGKTYTGRLDISPCHNSEVERYIRVVGYLAPVSSWSKARREEYKTRQFYTSDALN